jgi:hypothetical protein
MRYRGSQRLRGLTAKSSQRQQPKSEGREGTRKASRTSDARVGVPIRGRRAPPRQGRRQAVRTPFPSRAALRNKGLPAKRHDRACCPSLVLWPVVVPHLRTPAQADRSPRRSRPQPPSGRGRAEPEPAPTSQRPDRRVGGPIARRATQQGRTAPGERRGTNRA